MSELKNLIQNLNSIDLKLNSIKPKVCTFCVFEVCYLNLKVQRATLERMCPINKANFPFKKFVQILKICVNFESYVSKKKFPNKAIRSVAFLYSYFIDFCLLVELVSKNLPREDCQERMRNF